MEEKQDDGAHAGDVTAWAWREQRVSRRWFLIWSEATNVSRPKLAVGDQDDSKASVSLPLLLALLDPSKLEQNCLTAFDRGLQCNVEALRGHDSSGGGPVGVAHGSKLWPRRGVPVSRIGRPSTCVQLLVRSVR